MRADLIELLTSRTGQDFDGECHLTEEEARDIIDALASLSSPQEPVAWRDMSTAPKDGSVFLAVLEGAALPEACVTWWDGSNWMAYVRTDKFFGGIVDWKPTHWMPRPTFTSPVVPVAAKAEAEGWRLVPVEPTKEMLKAWSFTWGEPNARNCWRDMLAAAPTCEGERQP